MIRDSFLVFGAAASLILTACGSTRPEVKANAPAAAPLQSPVVEYRPGPAPAVEISTHSAAVMISTVPVTVLPGIVVIDTMPVNAPIIPANLPALNPVPHEPAPSIPSDANVVVVVSEAVGDPSQDRGSYTKVFVDNQLAGQTQKAPKSAQKRWGARLQPGNHLFRFEKWDLPMSGDWVMLDPQWQAPERFVRVEADTRAVIRLKFYDDGRGHNLQISRDSVAVPLP